MERRNLLKSCGALLSIGTFAGCLGSDESSREEKEVEDGEVSGQSAEDGGSATETEESDTKVEIVEQEFYTGDYGSFGVKGEAKNVSGEMLEGVTIETYYYDSEDTRLGEGLWTGSDIADGTTFKFDSTGLADVDAEQVDDYEIGVSTTNF